MSLDNSGLLPGGLIQADAFGEFVFECGELAEGLEGFLRAAANLRREAAVLVQAFGPVISVQRLFVPGVG